VCNFLDAPDLVFPYPANSKNTTEKGKERSKEEQAREDDIRVIYRHYATLYFV
jgi:AP-3 complex subunit sigma